MNTQKNLARTEGSRPVKKHQEIVAMVLSTVCFF
jgi:hypothetical protein